MRINTKPIMLDNINMALKQIPESSVIGIARMSAGVIGKPGEQEDIQIFYRDGCSERISILDMTPDEVFLKICSMISTHAALGGQEK